jgi:hypothetical protein
MVSTVSDHDAVPPFTPRNIALHTLLHNDSIADAILPGRRLPPNVEVPGAIFLALCLDELDLARELVRLSDKAII